MSKQPKNKVGRPTLYTDKLADEICAEVIKQPFSIHRICTENEAFPDSATVYRWLAKHEYFRDSYAWAKEGQSDLLRDEIIDISDDTANDTLTITNKKGESYDVENREWVNRSKIRTDNRRWLCERLSPTKYGTRVDLTSGGKEIGGGPDLSKLTF